MTEADDIIIIWDKVAVVASPEIAWNWVGESPTCSNKRIFPAAKQLAEKFMGHGDYYSFMKDRELLREKV